MQEAQLAEFLGPLNAGPSNMPVTKGEGTKTDKKLCGIPSVQFVSS